MQRYHSMLVVLHWLMALMILVALVAGGLLFANMAPNNPDKVASRGGCVAFGMAIGVLLIVCLPRSRK